MVASSEISDAKRILQYVGGGPFYKLVASKLKISEVMALRAFSNKQ